MKSPRPIRKVVIAGRDIAVWLSANVLMRALGDTGLTVEVVEMPGYLRSHDVIGALPPLQGLHHLLGIDEHELLKAVSGAYSLGQRYVNFAGSRPSFFRAYGAHGAPIGGAPFLQHYIQARHKGLKVAFEDFSLAASAAKQGRFFVPDATLSAFHDSQYGYHMNALVYAQVLKNAALRQGVAHIRAHDVSAERRDDYITYLTLSDGRRIDGDFFIDASGADGRLIGGETDSWSAWFPDNRILTVAAEKLTPLPTHAQAIALQGGVLHMAATQDATGLAHVYHADDMDDQQALDLAITIANLRPVSQATAGPLQVGRRRKPWRGNVVALGEAACVFHPIDQVSLHALHLGLVHLLSLFPLNSAFESDAEEYNRLTQEAYEGLRNYQISHFKLNRNLDQPYWDGARNMPIPPELQMKIDLFKACGRILMFDEETFEEEDWASIFFGHGLLPERWDRMCERTPQEVVINQFRQMLGFIREQVEGMSSHEAYIEIYAARNFV